MKKIFTTLSVAIAMMGFNAMAAEIYVDSANGNDANDGSQGAPLASLTKAIETVASGDIIVVSTASIPGDFNAEELLNGKTVTIQGATANRAENVITFGGLLSGKGVEILFKDLTITGNGEYADAHAKGDLDAAYMTFDHSQVTLDNCVIRDCKSKACTAVLNSISGTLTLNNCLAKDNVMQNSVVFFTAWTATTITDCQFINNTALEPGGYAAGVGRIARGSISVENCLIQGNQGAMYGSCFVLTNTGETAKFVNCTFKENFGRGCVCQNGGNWEILVDRCAFIDNYAASNGTVFFFANGTTSNLTVANSTFHGNSSGVGNTFGGSTCGFFDSNEGSQFNFYYVTMTDNNTGDSWVGNAGGINITNYGDLKIYNSIIENNWGPHEDQDNGTTTWEFQDVKLSGKGEADIQCSIIGKIDWKTGDDCIEPTFDEDMCIINQAPEFREVDGETINCNLAGLADFNAEYNYQPIASAESAAATMADPSLIEDEELFHDQFGNPRDEDNLCIGAVPLGAKLPEVGVETIKTDNVDNANAPAVYYNLQGQRVNNPARGLYIKQQGNKVSKVIL